jgi:hypothetical protein
MKMHKLNFSDEQLVIRKFNRLTPYEKVKLINEAKKTSGFSNSNNIDIPKQDESKMSEEEATHQMLSIRSENRHHTDYVSSVLLNYEIMTSCLDLDAKYIKGEKRKDKNKEKSINIGDQEVKNFLVKFLKKIKGKEISDIDLDLSPETEATLTQHGITNTNSVKDPRKFINSFVQQPVRFRGIRKFFLSINPKSILKNRVKEEIKNSTEAARKEGPVGPAR